MSEKAKNRAPAADPMFDSYVRLAEGLVGELSAVCLLDEQRRVRGLKGNIGAAEIVRHVGELHWNGAGARLATLVCARPGQWLTAVPLEQTDGTLLGAFCVQQALSHGPPQMKTHAGELARRLKPLLDCIHRELIASLPSHERIQTLTDKTAELEWLFKVTSNLQAASGEQHIIEELLAAATQRLGGALGVLEIPDKRLCVEFAAPHAGEAGWGNPDTLRGVWRQTRQSLLTWVQRRNQPLIANGVGRDGDKVPRCKILAVPVARNSGRVIGFLAFFNPPFARDFSNRHEYLARHLGRQAAAMIDSQFDLMTGLYTRAGLGRAYGALDSESQEDTATGSLVLIDVDRMHVINELHGFELGNELIVRIADLLAPPLLPSDALRARLSGDRFAVVLPEADARAAAQIAQRIQAAARELRIGPADACVEASVSCGVADVVAMPQALDRSIAAAEIACKTAKSRGRDRVAVYNSDDHSMMQRRSDAIAVGELRAALKSDRLLIYAERLKSLQDPSVPDAFQLSLRMLDADEGVVSPAPLLTAALRYQLMPSVDRWMVRNSLEMLAPLRGTLQSSGVSFALRVSGQSIADAAFVEHFAAQMSAARLPKGCITVVLGETAAGNLVRAGAAIERLQALGCGFALAGFGIGTHAMDYIKNFRIGRVEIDGNFVRNLNQGSGSKAAVRAIVELAAALAIQTAADGVDDPDARRVLCEIGVDFACGAVFGPPRPLDDLLPTLGGDESRRMRRLYLET